MKITLKEHNSKCRDGILEMMDIKETDTVILIFPGGGYHHLSTRESTPVANKFHSFGYDTAICYYSCCPFENQLPLIEANTSIEILKKTYKNIVVMGFSAGGHLAGMAMTDIYRNDIKAAILCYPVVSFITSTHIGTRDNFCNPYSDEETYKKFSLQNRVTKTNCPVFIWATRTDNAVPVENSDILINKLQELGVKVEYKFYPQGPHGMALADQTAIKDGDTSFVDKEVATWSEIAHQFLNRIL